MLRFYPPLIYEGQTSYSPVVPDRFQHLLIKDFNVAEYAKGAWGNYLAQSLKLSEVSCDIYHLYVNNGVAMFPVAQAAEFALQHLHKGYLYSEINGGIPVYSGEDRTFFLYLPPGVKQKTYFNHQPVISIHFNFSEEFIRQNIIVYPFLKELVLKFESDRGAAVSLGPVKHNYKLRHLWKRFYNEIRVHASPARLVGVMAREILNTYCELLEKQVLPGSFPVKAENLVKIHEVKEILERDFRETPTYKKLSAAVGLNEFYMKRDFKIVYGKPIREYLIDLKMGFAYNEIMTSDKKINVIAREVGYVNVAHFDKMFKKVFGVVPSELRE